MHVEQETNILASNRPCALVKTRYEWQLLNWVSGWRKSSGPVTSAKLTVAVTGLGVPVRKLLITLTLSGWSNPGYYILLHSNDSRWIPIDKGGRFYLEGVPP